MGIDWKAIAESLFLRPPPGSAAPALGGGVSVPLGSGYDRQVDIATAVATLTRLQQEAVALFPAAGSETYCNTGLQHVAKRLGCHDLDGLVATEMVRRAAALPGWRQDTWERAVRHAQQGGLAFLGLEGYPHGHVASVAALPMEQSGTWGCSVPILANVGKPPNGFKRASQCFLLVERPLIKTFLWGDSG